MKAKGVGADGTKTGVTASIRWIRSGFAVKVRRAVGSIDIERPNKGYCITDLSVGDSLATAVALKLLLATAADAEADAIDPTLEEKTIYQNSSLARADLDRYRRIWRPHSFESRGSRKKPK
ncbi:hypothetical protein BHM03_00020227 [Ensete ventricosum]|nr:hypothetical protein BHM03_00020227 [Ensete ventricosum]